MKHPYHEFITTVEKPGRSLGGDYQTTVNAWETPPNLLALTFTAPY